MRVFRGNLGQALIIESLLRSTGRVIKVKGGDEEPMFSVEKKQPSTVFYRTLLVMSDGTKAPSLLRPLGDKVYEVKIRYDLSNNKGYVRMTREVIDFLAGYVPDAKRIIDAMEFAEANAS